MEFQDIVQKRYATKLFSGKQLDESKVNDLLELIRLSASSFGLQPYKVLVVQNDELQEQLKEAAWGQEQLTTASHVLVFCAYPELKERIDQYAEMIGADDDNEYIQMMRDSTESKSDEELLAWSQRQLYIAVGNAINGAKALGFDSCPMEGFSPDRFKEILNIDENLTPTVIVPIGEAADTQHEKIRYPTDELFIHKN